MVNTSDISKLLQMHCIEIRTCIWKAICCFQALSRKFFFGFYKMPMYLTQYVNEFEFYYFNVCNN